MSIIGVDTESNSLYAYYHQVCLIQISLPGRDYVVDPLTVDVKPLGTLFANPACEKIFHAAENDILGLKRDYEFTFTNVFDTMLAARIMGWPRAAWRASSPRSSGNIETRACSGLIGDTAPWNRIC